MNTKLILPLAVMASVVALVFAAGRTPPPDRDVAATTRIDATSTVQKVDRLVAERWESESFEAPKPADELQVLRRLSLALHGTLPSLEEIRAFEADNGADRLDRWTERLLDDPRFGDYFAERLARSVVGTDTGTFVIYRRDRLVDWLSSQLNADRPWSVTARELIAGCGLWTGSPQTNFITAAESNENIDVNKLAGRTVRGFLGQRIDCAQCHDHPFDDWKQEDFEGLAAFYSQATFNLAGIRDQDSYLFELDRMPPKSGKVGDGMRRAFRRAEKPLRSDAVIMTVQPERLWIVGDQKGSSDEDAQVEPNEMLEEGALDFEPKYVIRRKSDTVFTVHDSEYEHIPDDVTTTEPRVIEPAPPFYPSWLGTEGSRRDRLAKWVTHPDNERFGRAMSNRVWGLVFGRPYFGPVDDLPDPGDTGTNVLDVLGRDFRAHGDSIKRLIRVVTATKAFRAVSTTGPLSSPADFENMRDSWAVFPMVRLRPEQVIGSMLQASYVRTINQNSHLFVRAARFFGEVNFVNEYGDLGDSELDDRAGTIPQALLRMNGEMTKDRTKVDAFGASGRILDLSTSDESVVENCFLVCLTRRPTPEEKAHFLKQFDGAGEGERTRVTEDLFWSLFNSDEFSWNH